MGSGLISSGAAGIVAVVDWLVVSGAKTPSSLTAHDPKQLTFLAGAALSQALSDVWS